MLLKIIGSLFILLVISVGISAYLIYIKRYKFFGDFWGATIVSFTGAVLFNYLLTDITNFFLSKLNLNILAAILGIILFLYILNKVTP